MSSQKSRYTLLFDNVSGSTPKRDVIVECERCAGPVLAAEKDSYRRQALVEFKSSKDADYAYRKLHGFRMDGRTWDVFYATREDFKNFGWRWTEGNEYSNDHYGGGGSYNSGYAGFSSKPSYESEKQGKKYRSPSPQTPDTDSR